MKEMRGYNIADLILMNKVKQNAGYQEQFLILCTKSL